MARITLIVICFACAYPSYSQSYLELHKLGTVGGIRYSLGEEIRFKQKGQDEFTRGLIVDFPTDSTIRFFHGYLNISEIAVVDIRRKLKHPEWKLVIAGVGFVGLEGLNSSLQGRSFQSNRGLWVPAGLMVGSGLLWNILKAKRYRVGVRKKVVIVRDLD